jgi:diaminopimelate epimerase
MLDIVKADPAGNITIFVLNCRDLDAAERAAAAKILLADKDLQAEQVGFVFAPTAEVSAHKAEVSAPTAEVSAHKAENGLWRLTMMGGEFCGNAARAFGLLAARWSGLRGRQQFTVEVSGAPAPVAVDVDCDGGAAAAAIPPPEAGGGIVFDGKTLPVYRFDGISHVIMEDAAPDRRTFFEVKALFEARFGKPDALGVMFRDTAEGIMRPAVYVYATESLVFESSCGSGVAAFACYRFEKMNGADALMSVKQPGGVITARVVTEDRRIKHIWIGGGVTLSKLSRSVPGLRDEDDRPESSI